MSVKKECHGVINKAIAETRLVDWRNAPNSLQLQSRNTLKFYAEKASVSS